MDAGRAIVSSDVWLWSERGGVRWWSYDDTGFLQIESPYARGEPLDIKKFRDARQACTLHRALQSTLADVIESALHTHARVRLRLTEDLANYWHTCPYEHLMVDGKPLFGRLLVERWAKRSSAPPRGPDLPDGSILHLLPRSDLSPLHQIDIRAFSSNKLKSLREVSFTQFLRQKDPNQHSFLCVIAHGTESGNDLPIRLPDGRNWELPLERGLPRLVILLVCGGDPKRVSSESKQPDTANLLIYARQLLEAGAETVLAPVGQLDATASGVFLNKFLTGWYHGESVAQLLLLGQAVDETGLAARRLNLLGNGDLRAPDSPYLIAPIKWTEEKVKVAAEGDVALLSALSVLLERITLNSYQQEGNAGPAVAALYDCLGLPYADPNEDPTLFHALDHLATNDDLSPLTKRWLYPFLGYLAEDHDHARMGYDRSARLGSTVQVASLPDAAIFYHYFATPKYRRGEYSRGVKTLIKGFEKLALVGAKDPCSESGVSLLGNLANHLIDLNLPREARLILDELSHCLGRHDFDARTIATEGFKVLDREARCAVREGSITSLGDARFSFEKKHGLAVQDKQDGWRELAWLLYVSAWAEEETALAYANEIQALLGDVEKTVVSLGNGNDKRLYMLRALALWAWRGNDARAASLVHQYMSQIQKSRRSSRMLQDTGPLGFTAAFLALHDPSRKGELWPEAHRLLESYKYWLELVAFCYLLGESVTDVEKFWMKFNDQRQQVFDQLKGLPEWLALGAFAGKAWQERETAFARQLDKERTLLLVPPPERSVNALISVGFLPM